jgi:hypothetical protein
VAEVIFFADVSYLEKGIRMPVEIRRSSLNRQRGFAANVHFC